MPRPKSETPSRRFHISGQSVVTIDGRDFYLGPHDSPEAIARYSLLLSTYQRGGLCLPCGFRLTDIEPKVEAFLSQFVDSGPVHLENEPITVGHLAEAYRVYIQDRYGKPHQKIDLARRRGIVDRLIEHDSKTLVAEFGPVKLKKYRQRFIDEGDKSRRYINKLTNEIRAVFSWGVAEELVKPAVVTALECVKPLLGNEAAYEIPKRQAVPLEHVQATISHLSPIVRDMVRVQIQTGCRPSEVCNMRPRDIDRSGEVWFYRPTDHKTAWKGHSKEVPILGDARKAIENYLNRKSDSPLFSPKEAMDWFRAKLSAERWGYGSYKKHVAVPKKQPGDQYDAKSYTKAIQRAAKAAGVPPWTAYQIRHLVGTTVGESLKLENVKALLGHADLATSQIYSKATRTQAIEAAKAAPKL